MTQIKKTAREHCASRRTPCSWEIHRENSPAWKKCGGYILAADEFGNVMNGMIYAIELHNGTPSLHRYTRKGLRGIAAHCSYSIRTLQPLLRNPDNWESHEITFDEMLEEVADTFPGIVIPTPSRFCIEYGIKYDRYTCEMSNYVGLIDD